MKKTTKHNKEPTSAIGIQYIDDLRIVCYSDLDSATRRVIEIYEENIRKYGRFTIEGI